MPAPDRAGMIPSSPGIRGTLVVMPGHPRTADEVLRHLLDGNARFVRAEPRFSATRKEKLADPARAQQPFATVLGCSDSRVAPELVFDAGLGELFVIRVAGNVVSPEILGSLQYAAVHLQTPLFVVLGHEGCGAVSAALDAVHRGAQHHSRIQHLLDGMLAGLAGVEPGLAPDQELQCGVEANVRWSIHQLRATPEAQMREAEGAMRLVGAIYEIATGHVRLLPGETG
jgi:carbonic anhydrase